MKERDAGGRKTKKPGERLKRNDERMSMMCGPVVKSETPEARRDDAKVILIAVLLLLALTGFPVRFAIVTAYGSAGQDDGATYVPAVIKEIHVDPEKGGCGIVLSGGMSLTVADEAFRSKPELLRPGARVEFAIKDGRVADWRYLDSAQAASAALTSWPAWVPAWIALAIVAAALASAALRNKSKCNTDSEEQSTNPEEQLTWR